MSFTNSRSNFRHIPAPQAGFTVLGLLGFENFCWFLVIKIKPAQTTRTMKRSEMRVLCANQQHHRPNMAAHIIRMLVVCFCLMQAALVLCSMVDHLLKTTNMPPFCNRRCTRKKTAHASHLSLFCCVALYHVQLTALWSPVSPFPQYSLCLFLCCFHPIPLLKNRSHSSRAKAHLFVFRTSQQPTPF